MNSKEIKIFKDILRAENKSMKTIDEAKGFGIEFNKLV